MGMDPTKIDKRITDSFIRTCSGCGLDPMHTDKVFDLGRELIATGANDFKLDSAMRKLVQSLLPPKVQR